MAKKKSPTKKEEKKEKPKEITYIAPEVSGNNKPIYQTNFAMTNENLEENGLKEFL